MVGRGGCSGRLCGWVDDGRMRSLPGVAAAGAVATRTGREKAPPTVGLAGPFRDELYFDLSLSPTPELPRSYFAGLLISRYF